MGLRSRTGSQGTVKTSRTFSGVSAESLAEEGEDGEQGSGERGVNGHEGNVQAAGPSTRRSNPPAGQQSMDQVGHGREGGGEGENTRASETGSGTTSRLNPKSSSSWLRWNSPAPAFPKSVSRDKGKGRAEDEQSPDQSQGQETIARTESPTDITGEGIDPIISASSVVPPGKEEEQSRTETEATSTLEQGDEEPHQTDALSVPVPKGRWWSRPSSTKLPSTPIDQTRPAIEPQEASIAAEANTAMSRSSKTDSLPPNAFTPSMVTANANIAAKPVNNPVELHSSSPDSMAISEGTAVTARESLDSTRDTSAQNDAESKTTRHDLDTATGKGWFGYFGKGKSIPSGPVDERQQEDGDQDSPIESLAEITAPAAEEIPTPSVVPQAEDTNETPDTTASPPVRAGWGTYLYSFVATPAAPEASPETAPENAVIPSDPAEDQKPVTTESPFLAVEAAGPLPADSSDQASSSLPSQSASNPANASTPTHRDLFLEPERSRKASSASQSGWLNYLAFKASQKKVTNASNASIKSGKERKSVEGERGEEVMDLSSDPNFPTPAPAAASSAAGSPVLSTTATMGASVPDSEDKDIKTGKDKTLNRKGSQALAVKNRTLSSSSNNAGNHTPLSSSPMSKPPVNAANNSALPAPPAPAQPNFIIPTFETTFDRPPRSLPPVVENQAGLTATTTGLAWKALGAVGSYVYGGTEVGDETRGMREGRKVGMELPRRVGLEKGMGEDDGWKNVRRVAVVGVHGWFPAKMLNSCV